MIGQLPVPAVEGTRGRPDSQRAVLALLALATMLASTGLAAGGTAGSLLSATLTGTDALAGVPVGALVLGSAVAALGISRYASRGGWGRGLLLGYVVGVSGGALVVVAAIAGSIALLLAGSVLLGAANAAVFLTRYAAAELAGEAKRGRAIGIIFLATAIGAVASPSLLGPSGTLAHSLGLPALSGLYLVAAGSFATSALLFAALSHPAVPYLGRGAALLGPSQRSSRARVGRGEIATGLRATPAQVALLVLAVTNLIMVAMMAIAPVHLMQMMDQVPMTYQMPMPQMPAPVRQSLELQVIGMVVSLHVAGMFVPAPITGWLADRVGSVAVALTGIALLIVAGITGTLISQHSAWSLRLMLLMLLMLIILGVGWNCGVVGGSVLLAASVPAALRPHVEGIGEVVMGVAAALGAPAAGALAAVGGVPALSGASMAIALLALALVWKALRCGARGSSANETHPAPVQRTGARSDRLSDTNRRLGEANSFTGSRTPEEQG